MNLILPNSPSRLARKSLCYGELLSSTERVQNFLLSGEREHFANALALIERIQKEFKSCSVLVGYVDATLLSEIAPRIEAVARSPELFSSFKTAIVRDTVSGQVSTITV